jgi:putative ABC transport system permease protein
MAWYHRLGNLIGRERLSRDLDRELEFHIAERADALVAAGMDEAEARREARRRFGNVLAQKERTGEVDVVVWLESLLADLRYAFRALRLSPGFTFVAVLSIALGVGANTAIFSLINAVMLKSLPVQHPEELVKLTRGPGDDSFTNPLWEAIRDRQDVVDAFAYSGETFNLANGGEARRLDGTWVSGSYFPVLGARAQAGRLLSPEDDRRGCGALAVVSAGFAASAYGSPEGAVGRPLVLDGHPFEIVGVTEPSFFGVEVGSAPRVFVPICAEAILRGHNSGLDVRARWWLQLMARPRGHMTLAETAQRLALVAPGINEVTLPPDWEPRWQNEYMKGGIIPEPAATGFSSVRERYSGALVALMVVVGVVLLIACANVAHLLLARAAARQREMAVRLAIGAGRGRLIRQLLTESILLSLLGAALGVMFARWASAFLVGFFNTRNDRVWLDLTLDRHVLLFTIGVATLTGLLFGLAPAWRAARVAPQLAMQAHARSIAGRGRFAITRGLVVGQVALSLVLLVAAGLLLRSFQRLVTMDPGFRSSGVLLVSLDAENAGYVDSQLVVVYRDVLERLRALPGVRAASASIVTPISGSGWNQDVQAEGFTPKSERDGIMFFNGVTEDYFTTLGTRRIGGRDFGREDVRGGLPVAIVNEALVHKVFGGASPIGRMIRTNDGPSQWITLEIVGLVEDAKYRSLRDEDVATVYRPLAQSRLWGAHMNFAVRLDGDPAAAIPMVTSVVGGINHSISLEFVTLREQVAASLARPRLLATLSVFFGTLALLLATVGLYGTVAYSVARRHNEIGIRIALGAERAAVVRMVLGEVARLLVTGTVVGVAIAAVSTRLLASFLFGLTPTDPFTLAASVAALATVALAAGAIPAWRAARVDPVEALREE